MPRNGSGTYTLPAGNPVVTGTTISSTTQNTTMSDVAAELTNSIAADGQKTPTANLPMGNFKHTGVANANARDQYAAAGQVQDGAFLWAGTAGGTADVITLSPIPSITAYAAGQTFRFISSGTNTTNATVNVSGLGAKALTKVGATALVAGDIQTANVCEIVYDGTQFQLLNIVSLASSGGTVANLTLVGALNLARSTVAATATTTPLWTATSGNIQDWTGTPTITDFPAAPQAGAQREVYPAVGTVITNAGNISVQGNANYTVASGDKLIISAITATTFYVAIVPKNGAAVYVAPLRTHISGLTLSQTGSSSTMSISAGQATDSTNAVSISLASAIAKTTGSWAVGNGNGGLDTGTIANNTGYHFFAIMRPDTGVVDVLCSLSATAPTLPTSYTYFRRIGWGLANSSAQWVKIVQVGDYFTYNTPILDVDGTTGTAAALTALTVPVGVKVLVKMNLYTSDSTSGAAGIYISDPDTADAAPSITAAPLATVGLTGSSAMTPNSYAECFTNTSGQIRRRGRNATNYLRLATLGWVDFRGKEL